MLSLSSHLGRGDSGSNEMSIQTADLLNLNAEETLESSRKHFDVFETSFSDPFSHVAFSKSSVGNNFTASSSSSVACRNPSLESSSASISATPPLTSMGLSVLSPPIIKTQATSFPDSFGDTFVNSFASSAPITISIPGPHTHPHPPPALHANTLIPPPKSPKVKLAESSVSSSSSSSSTNNSHYSTIRPRKKTTDGAVESKTDVLSVLSLFSNSGNNNSNNSNNSSSASTGHNQNSLAPVSIAPPQKKTLIVRQPSIHKSTSIKLTASIPRPSGSSSSPKVFTEPTTTSSTSIRLDGQSFGCNFSSLSKSDFFPPQPQNQQQQQQQQQLKRNFSGLEHLDIFTDLDPLGTGRSKPYVDKKDFFQDLKPAKKPMQNQASVVQFEDDYEFSSNHNSLSTTASSTIIPTGQPFDAIAHTSNRFSEDPFGCLQFVPTHQATPMPDPFDTTSSSSNVPAPLFSAAFPPSNPSPPPPHPPPPPLAVATSAASASSAVANNPSLKPHSAIPTAPVIPPMPTISYIGAAKPKSPYVTRHQLRVAIPASQSDSDSETSITLASMRNSPGQGRMNTSVDSVEIPPPPRSCPAGRQSSLRSLTSMETAVQSATPAQVADLSSSEEETSSSEEASDRVPTDNSDELPMPPQPPPRPPIMMPPPLPPKGQPPTIPQRPSATPTDEELHNNENGPSPTPPLPIPVRKPKLSTGSRYSRRVSHEDAPPTYPNADAPRSKLPSKNRLNHISLGHLSNMSLVELASTLRLPPARLACMTLTELALRLAELNQSNDVEDHSEEDVFQSGNSSDSSPSQQNQKQHRPQQQVKGKAIGQVHSDQRTGLGEEEEEDEEEEEEDDQVQINIDEAEVCFKGGKKYEMLSDAQEAEPEEAFVANAVSDGQNACDKYAALREIMQQDLGVASIPAAISKPTAKEEQFADFDDMDLDPPNKDSVESGLNDLFNSLSIVRNTSTTRSNNALGFDDNFTASGQAAQSKIQKTDEAFSATGARPKIRSNPKVASISSGSVDFDDSIDEDSRSASKFIDAGLLNQASSWSNLPAREFVQRHEDEPSNRHMQNAPSGSINQSLDPDEDFADEFADKFAAFEARFPENPLEGFGDSFNDFDLSASRKKKGEPFADFDSAFGRARLDQSQIVKKSQSVNIFKRVDDPFDDDFFQVDEPKCSAKGHDDTPPPPGVEVAAAAAAKLFTTIVEDPFAWVQPFDDNFKFNDEFE